MLLEKIQGELKTAMKERDAAKVSTLRLLISALKNERIAKNKDLTDQDETEVLMRQAKQRRDSIEQFTKGGRTDLADTETAELTIIESYLPEQMSEAEVRTAAQEKIAALGITDASGMGKVMGALMSDLKGKADGKMVKDVVNKLLQK